MLQVWTDGEPSGALDRFGRGSSFSYTPGASERRSVSLTMPVRVASWNSRSGLNPIFQMNMPEGRLRERLRLDFAKTVDHFDDLDLLGIVGRQQIGRLRYSAFGTALSNDMPLQSIDEILTARHGGELYEYLLAKYAQFSGISGVQPKVLVNAQKEAVKSQQALQTVRGATHIVKFWDEFEELAANEFFCLTSASLAGIRLPDFQLSETGDALVIKRFDLRDDGKYRGFEDFCVLNGIGTDEKYDGSYETRLFRRIKDIALGNLDGGQTMLREAFEIMVFNYAVRNGDAHLKNFGVVYDDAAKEVELAPAYDIVTTTPYIPADMAALTLGGTKRWPNAKMIVSLGQIRAGLSMPEIRFIMERTADALADTAHRLIYYFRDKDSDIGMKMMSAWSDGIKNTLELTGRSITVAGGNPLPPDFDISAHNI